jgi:hypothetical protein
VSQPHFHDEELRKYETKTCLLKRRRLILNPSVMVRSELESQTSVRDGEKGGKRHQLQGEERRRRCGQLERRRGGVRRGREKERRGPRERSVEPKKEQS